MKITLLLFCYLILSQNFTRGQKEPATKKYYCSYNGGLCSESIVLFSDSTYLLERGCESSSNVSFGTWKPHEDSIIFLPFNIQKSGLIKSITALQKPGNQLSLIVFDRNNNNITSKIAAGQYVKRLGIYRMDPDSSNQKKTDAWRDSSFIVLRSLQKMFGITVHIPTGTSNYFEITVNIPGEIFVNENSEWAERKRFILFKEKDDLVYPTYSMFDDKIIYKRTVQ